MSDVSVVSVDIKIVPKSMNNVKEHLLSKRYPEQTLSLVVQVEARHIKHTLPYIREEQNKLSGNLLCASHVIYMPLAF